MTRFDLASFTIMVAGEDIPKYLYTRGTSKLAAGDITTKTDNALSTGND